MSVAVNTKRVMPRPSEPTDESTFSGKVGAIMRLRRNKRELSVPKFAEAVGVRPTTVYSWEQGDNPIPLDLLPRIAAVLGCTVRKLFPPE